MSNIRKLWQLSAAPLLTVSLFSGAGQGQECEEETVPELAVFFGNGMFNAREEAYQSAISSRLGSRTWQPAPKDSSRLDTDAR